ncbi:unnamed protein product [Prunus armeniaca]
MGQVECLTILETIADITMQMLTKNQKIISSDKSQGNKLVARGFVQTDVLEACAEMIIKDKLPFNFVEKKGFRKFCSVTCPLFNVPSRRTILR